MPYKPKRPCRYPYCTGFAEPGHIYCAEHAAHEPDRLRGTAAQRGYDGRWQKESRLFLKANPLCAECLKKGRHAPATVVDHIVPHRGDRALFWDMNNWQGLCVKCHGEKTGHGL